MGAYSDEALPEESKSLTSLLKEVLLSMPLLAERHQKCTLLLPQVPTINTDTKDQVKEVGHKI